MKNTVKKLSLRCRKYALVFLCLILFAPALFCSAQTVNNTNQNQTQTQRVYYLLSVVWDSSGNTLKLKDGTQVSITTKNLTNDTGAGSQFYARVINFNNKPEFFDDGQSKIFLGNWSTSKGSTSADINLTIPAYKDGLRVMIFDTKTKKTTLSLNVSKFAQIEAAVKQNQSNANNTANAVTYTKTGSSMQRNITLSVVIIIFLGIIAGLIIFFIRRRRKNSSQIELSSKSNSIIMPTNLGDKINKQK